MNTVVKKTPFQKLFRTWVDWFAASFLGFFFSIMTLGFYSKRPLLVLIIIAQLLFFYGMMYNCGQHSAKYDRLKISGVDSFSPKWALSLSIFANLIPIFTTLLQLVFQLCGFKKFLPFYKIININFVPLLYITCPDSNSGKLNLLSYIAIFSICVISIAVVFVTYFLAYKDVDVKAILIYDNKKHNR